MEYKLLSPIKVGNKVLRNRIVMPPMECRYNTIDGSPMQRMIDYYEARAKGGAGMIIIENTYIDNRESRSSCASSGFYSDHLIPAKAQLAEAIKDQGCVAIIQLSHGGRQANAAAMDMECVAPSAIPSKAVQRMPRALSVEEIHRIEDDFAEAALRAKKAGFDGVEVHCAHGYLLSEFFSPYSNKRTDEYGGSYENRARMLKETIAKVREKVGKRFIVGMRINVDDLLGDDVESTHPEESCRLAKEVQHLLDYVSCTAGSYENTYRAVTLSTYKAPGNLVPLAAIMKKSVSIPVIAVGSLDKTLGEQVLERGQADLVAFGRQLIADPEFPRKLMEGRPEDIRPCCRANEGCVSGFELGYPMRCELNPSVGRERQYQIKEAADKKRVVILGGGCAGMEAARVCDLMGHEVILLEKSDHLGGHLIEATLPSFKNKTLEALEWLIRQVKKGKTQVQLCADVSPERVKELKPDVVILAVGSTYTQPPFPGKEKAMFADEAIIHPERTGKRVAVIGGGLVGVETAMLLAETKGSEVTIVEMMDGLAPNMDGNAHEAMEERVKQDKITVLCSHKVCEIMDGGLTCQNKEGELKKINADTVVMAIGLTANRREAEKYAELGIKTVEIGDCVQARSISSCMSEAWRAAFQI